RHQQAQDRYDRLLRHPQRRALYDARYRRGAVQGGRCDRAALDQSRLGQSQRQARDLRRGADQRDRQGFGDSRMKIRRIVTGHDASGRSLVAADSLIDSQPGKMQAAISIANLWLSTLPPALDGADPARSDFPVLPSNGGSVFRILELMPGTAPHMHKTETIDYIVVLA